MRFSKLFILLTIFANPSFAADFSFKIATRDWGTKVAVINLEGPITEGDYANYLETFDWVSQRTDVVLSIGLNSNGGSVGDALLIGKHVREHRLVTFILENSECYSSCALIFLSGLMRNNNGKLGVHRSYFKRGVDLSFDELENALGKSHDKIADYLRDMRVPERIIEDFLTTSSAEIKLLSKVPHDRLYEEYIISKCGVKPDLSFPKYSENDTLEDMKRHQKQTKYIFSEQSKVDTDRYYACFNPVLEDLIKTAQQ